MTAFERLVALVTRVRAGEGRTVALFGSHVFLILFAYYIFRSVREGLLLESGSAARGSYATAVIAAVLLVLVPVYAAVRRRYDGARLVNAIIAFFIGTLVCFWVAARAGADVGFAFYVWVGIFNVMMIAQFWALAADSFNVKTGQRLFPAIMLAAQLGALCGAQFTEALARVIGTNNLLLVGIVLLILTASFTGLMHANVPEGSRAIERGGEREPHRPFGGFQVIAASRYLALIALMIVLINWISSTGDFIHRDFVKRHFEAVAAASVAPAATRDLITAYMANFFFWMIVLQLVIQVFVVGRLFRRLGVATTLLIPGVLSLVGYALVGFLPLLSVIRMVRMGEQSVEYSLTNTLRQALFLPTTRAETYEGKTAIETFFWRFGDLVQAGVVFAGTTYLAMDARAFAFLNAALAAFWIAVAFAIGRHYRELAARNLTNAAPQLTRAIPHAECCPGEPFEHMLPRDLFIDHDPGDVLTLTAQRHDGSPLPDWLRFDARRHRFHGNAVGFDEPEILVLVVATDHDGVSVSGTFVIRRRIAAV
ncbi:MAG TPA: putative Ig domain-containing protein [Candidatus Saccharimonadia bacterium]|nr:putative Ig domain-containing protein [Candidatus Saccharimonadia bacterium]